MMKHSKTAKKEKKRAKLACVTQSHHVIPSKKKGCAYVLLMKGVYIWTQYCTVLIECTTI